MQRPSVRIPVILTALTLGASALPTPGALGVLGISPISSSEAAPPPTALQMVHRSSYDSGNPLGGSEIVAYGAERMFTTNGVTNSMDIVDISDVTAPTLVTSVPLAPYGPTVQSVAVHGNLVAVAVGGSPSNQVPGRVAFFDLDGTPVADVEVGALPDMVTFTPDGTTALVSNEGEPRDYCSPAADDFARDPRGSVSLIDVSGTIEQADVTDVGFTAYDGQEAALRAEGIRIFGPGASSSQDLEPEYIAVSADGTTAFVTLQENNALAIIDIATATVSDLVPLGTKDHSTAGNGLDPSDRDDGAGGPAIAIVQRPVRGMYQPDAIAAFEAAGGEYLLTANEGDMREYDCLLGGTGLEAEDGRAGSIGMDPTIFAGLTGNEALGRLNVTRLFPATTNGSNQLTSLYAPGARSFSVWDTSGTLVYDSGDDVEQFTASLLPDRFNGDWSTSTGAPNSFDSRSDNKGPEVESTATGVIDGVPFGFIGLERTGGVAMYDLTDPTAPVFVQYLNTGDFSGNVLAGTAGDVSPEGLHVVEPGDSPTGNALLLVAHEVSGTTAVIEITDEGVVAGTVIEDGTGSPLAGISVRLLDPSTAIPQAVTTTDVDGTYRFDGAVAGDHKLRFIDLDGAHLPEFHPDAGTAATATSITVSPGATTTVDAALAPGATGAITGTVREDGSGAPLPGISVRLLTTGHVLVGGRTTAAAGNYRFGLRDHGSYIMRFIDLDASHVNEYHFDSSTRAAATVITHDAWTTTIDASLAATP